MNNGDQGRVRSIDTRIFSPRENAENLALEAKNSFLVCLLGSSKIQNGSSTVNV